MKIQWFPGHMHKTSQAIAKNMPEMDCVIEVLDARIPYSSENPMIKALRGNKPCIKLLTKSDLADSILTEQWQKHLEKEHHIKTMALNLQSGEKIKQIPALCKKMMTTNISPDQPIKVMIIGVPNVGKSTLINQMVGRAITKTGNEAAVTRHLQRINLSSDFALYDTPGMLWHNISNENTGYRLAITGGIKDTAYEYPDIAFYLAEYCLLHYMPLLIERYNLDNEPQTPIDFFEEMGKKRGCIRVGNQVDLEKTCKLFISEYRQFKLGEMTLETPEMSEREIAEVDQVTEEKEREKKQSKAMRKKRWKRNRK